MTEPVPAPEGDCRNGRLKSGVLMLAGLGCAAVVVAAGRGKPADGEAIGAVLSA